MRKMRYGALLGLIIALAGTIITQFALLGGLPARLLELLWYLLCAVFFLIQVWLLTLPEPENPYWQFWLRWIARAGAAGWVAQSMMKTVVVQFLQSSTQMVAPLYAQAEMVSSCSIVGSAWYISRLAIRLNDRLLRVMNLVYAWVVGVIFGLNLLRYATDRPEAIRNAASQLSSDQDWGAGYRLMFSHPAGIVIWVGLGLVLLYMQWRLWSRLRAVERSAQIPGHQ